MKKFIHTGAWCVLFAGIITLCGFISRQNTATSCRGLEINIDRAHNNFFIPEEEIKELFFNMGYRVDSQLLQNVNTKKIEQQVYNNPSAKIAEVYTTIDGKVKIDIVQRKPVLRVFTESGASFYIDEEGGLMPLSDKYTSRVLVANGNISSAFAENYKINLNTAETDTAAGVLSGLFHLAKFIVSDKFWTAQVTQVYVNAHNEFELIPRVGNHNILFGDTSDMEEKFEKLMIFYREGLKRCGWNTYSEINLKFKDQVVCRKK